MNESAGYALFGIAVVVFLPLVLALWSRRWLAILVVAALCVAAAIFLPSFWPFGLAFWFAAIVTSIVAFRRRRRN